jgi:hypothetical protein
MNTFGPAVIYSFLPSARLGRNHFEIAERHILIKVGTNEQPKRISPFFFPLQQLQLCFLTACA